MPFANTMNPGCNCCGTGGGGGTGGVCGGPTTITASYEYVVYHPYPQFPTTGSGTVTLTYGLIVGDGHGGGIYGWLSGRVPAPATNNNQGCYCNYMEWLVYCNTNRPGCPQISFHQFASGPDDGSINCTDPNSPGYTLYSYQASPYMQECRGGYECIGRVVMTA